MAQRKPNINPGLRRDYRLYVDELFDAIARELATVTAFLHPAERQSGVGAYGIVDGDAAAFNHLGRDTLAPGQIARDDAATEPENRVVGGGDRLRLVLHWNDSRHGTEQFILVGRHAFAHVSQNGGWVIGPGVFGNLSSEQCSAPQTDPDAKFLGGSNRGEYFSRESKWPSNRGTIEK